ncbi:MAG: hypothetical protein AAFQ89_24370 [Cyanobacteria bacterium J06626_18]
MAQQTGAALPISRGGATQMQAQVERLQRQVEAERRRAELAEQQFEAECQRAERMAERLRSLGIDPDNLPDDKLQ